MSDIFPSEQHRMVLLTQLKTLGVTRVEVEFSGGGDSGSIDDVRLSGINGEVEALGTIVWPKESTYFDRDEDSWRRVVKDHSLTLKQVIEDVTHKALDYTALDWYNNEGGQGTFTIDLTKNPPAIDLEVGINIRETEDHSFNFSGTEDEE